MKLKTLIKKEKPFFVCMTLALIMIYVKYFVETTEIGKLSAGMYAISYIVIGYMTTLRGRYQNDNNKRI